MRVSKLKSVRLRWLQIVVLAVILLAALPVAACASVPPSSPMEDPISPREYLVQANLGNAPIVDAVTPKPDLAGVSVLYVDGKYYAQAPADVADFVVSAAESGKPIVILGTGTRALGKKLEEKLGTRLSMSCTGGLSSVSDDGIRTPLPIYGAAIKLYPADNGRFLVSMAETTGTEKAGGDNVIKYMQEWLEREAKRYLNNDTAEFVQPSIKNNGSTDIFPVGYAETSIEAGAGGHAGRYSVFRTYSQILNDGHSEMDWWGVEYRSEMVPGDVTYGNGWKSDWMDFKAYLTHPSRIPPDPLAALQDYGPSTIYGQAHISGSIGTPVIGRIVNDNRTSMSYSYDVTDVIVGSSSDMSQERFQLRHDIDKTKAAGRTAYVATPIAAYRQTGGWTYWPHEYYRANFSRQSLWHWDYTSTGWVSPDNITVYPIE